MMKRRTIILLLIVGMVLPATAGIILSQNGFDLSWWTVDSGSSTLYTNSGYTLQGTIGQIDGISNAVLAPSGSGDYGLGSGFWQQPLSEPAGPLTISLAADPGYNNIQLVWTPSNNLDANTYRISRTIEGQGELPAQTTTTNLYYFDDDAALQPGTSYCYQVEALDAGNEPYATSNEACATAGEVALQIPDVWAQAEGTAIIPVHILNAQGLGLEAADIAITFDDSMLTPISVTHTALTAAYDWTFDISGDTVTVSTADATAPVLFGDGALFWLTVDVLATGDASSTLDLLESSQITYEGDTVLLTVADGTFRTTPLGANQLGDLDSNGVIETADASLALEIASGALQPTPQQLAGGDVNGNGTIDAADASMILYYVENDAWPPVPAPATRSAGVSDITVGLGEASGKAQSTVPLTLTVSSLTDWAGGSFAVIYNRNLVAGIADVETAGIAADFDVSFSDSGSGLLTISMAGGAPVSGEGDIAVISLKIASDATAKVDSTLVMAWAALNDIQGRDFATSALQQPVVRSDGLLKIESSITRIYMPIIAKS